MTPDEKAREIAERWVSDGEGIDQLSDEIATALLAARREGIEEAAKVVELYAFPAKQTIATAIRALP